MVTQRTPASTSRRAIRHPWPSELRPYSSRSGSGSVWMSNAALAADDVIRSNALAEAPDRPGVAVGRPPRRCAGSGRRRPSSSRRDSSRASSRAGGGTMSGTAKSGAFGSASITNGAADGAEVGRAGARVHLRQTDVRRHRAPGPSFRAMTDPSAGRWLFGLRPGVERGRRVVAGQHVVVGRGRGRNCRGGTNGSATPCPSARRAAACARRPGCPARWSDRLELAAELGRRVGLEVPGVDGAQAAVEEDEDQRHVLCRLSRRGGGRGLPPGWEASAPCRTGWPLPGAAGRGQNAIAEGSFLSHHRAPP